MFLLERSKYYAIHQMANTRYFSVDFGQKQLELTFCQLLALREKINAISIVNHFDSNENPHGFEILTFCNKEHLFILNTLELLDLKACIQNAFVIMGLSPQPSTVLQ